MISYMVGKLSPNPSHPTKGLVKYVPGKGYFRAVPSQNGDKIVTSPPPQSLNGSGGWFLAGNHCRDTSHQHVPSVIRPHTPA